MRAPPTGSRPLVPSLQVDGALDDACGDDPWATTARTVPIGCDSSSASTRWRRPVVSSFPLLGGQQARHRVDHELRAVPLAAEPDAPLSAAAPRWCSTPGLGERFQDLQVVLAHDSRSLQMPPSKPSLVPGIVLGAGRQCRHRGHLPILAFGALMRSPCSSRVPLGGHALDLAGPRGGDGRLHLHRLEHGDGLSLGHLVALAGRHGHDAGQRRGPWLGFPGSARSTSATAASIDSSRTSIGRSCPFRRVSTCACRARRARRPPRARGSASPPARARSRAPSSSCRP